MMAITHCWGSAVAAPPAPAHDSLKFTRLGVKDPGINNIEAVSFLIPAGWKVEGGIKWFPEYSILANLLMRISDPQTGGAIEFLPVQNFTWLTQMVGALGLLVPRPQGAAGSPDAPDEHDGKLGAAQPGVVRRVHVRSEAVSGSDEPEHQERGSDQRDDHAEQRGNSPHV